MHIYSIYDRKAGYFLPVFNVRSDADAVRQFKQIVVQSDTDISKWPADFDLCRLARFDLQNGRIEPEIPFGTVMNGLVALQEAHSERSRYAKSIESAQVDIEDLLTAAPSS